MHTSRDRQGHLYRQAIIIEGIFDVLQLLEQLRFGRYRAEFTRRLKIVQKVESGVK